MQRDIIRVNGEPVLVKLDFDPEAATQREGQYGVDWQYVVNDDAGIMWLPRAGRDALLKCGARAGDNVAIRKYKRGKAWQWEAECVSDAAEPEPAPEPQQRYANGAQFPKRCFANPEPEARSQKPEDRRRNAPSDSRLLTPVSSKPPVPFADYLCLAIDAVAIAQEYGREKGVSVTFLGGDVRAIANAIYINATGGK